MLVAHVFLVESRIGLHFKLLSMKKSNFDYLDCYYREWEILRKGKKFLACATIEPIKES